jgi:uncharacterized protein YndB with AHSA1/START domain
VGFPDRIERTVELGHRPEVVWDALTTAEGLASWLGDRATVDLRPGGAATAHWTAEDATAEIRVERVEPFRVFGFTWRVDGMPPEDPRRTYVEFTLEPTASGTRLHLVESGFAQLPDEGHRRGHASHEEGWTHELGDLVAYLDAA